MRFSVITAIATTFVATVTAGGQDSFQASQYFEVPSLPEIRSLLAQFVPAIVHTIVQRMALPVDLELYCGGENSNLHKYLSAHENLGLKSQRYAYGTLEYAFTFNTIVPDHVSQSNAYPPGRFHQDTFTPNDNLLSFYVESFVPLLNASSVGYSAHLSNTTQKLFPGRNDNDAALSIDVALLQLLSNRAGSGKAVAESKYLGSPDIFRPLIKAQDSNGIHALLLNRTQEGAVLEQADSAALAFVSAWMGALGTVSENFESNIRNATFKVFRNLIDITTQTEVDYLLRRLD